jgi:prepilin-type processing-associated H-X9-DG protein
MHRRLNDSRGFGIVELLVVLGIIVILVGLLAPALMKSRRAAESIQCRGQLQQIGQAIAAYAAENAGAVIPYSLDAYLRRIPWTWFLFREQFPRVVVCPTGVESGDRQTYMLNLWLHLEGIRLHGRGLRSRPTSTVVLAGENLPGICYEYYPLVAPDSDILAHDPFRHGRALRSNYLWLDFHVGNEAKLEPNLGRDAWYVGG